MDNSDILSTGSDEILGDFGFVVKWKCADYVFEFTASRITGRNVHDHSDIETRDAVSGSVKWDGCANILYPQNSYVHYCEPDDLIKQSELLRWVYEKARSEMPNNEISEWPTA